MLRRNPGPGHLHSRLTSHHSLSSAGASTGPFLLHELVKPVPTPGPPSGQGTRSVPGSTLCVLGARLAFLLLLPLDFGLEALDLPAQAGDDIRVLCDVVGHGQQVALDLEGPGTCKVSARGCPAGACFRCDACSPKTHLSIMKIHVRTTQP